MARQTLSTMKSDLLKYFGFLLTVIALVAGAVGWASSEHTSISKDAKEYSDKKDKEIKEEREKYYVPKEDLARVQENQKALSKDIEDVNKKLDKIYEGIRKIRDKETR